MKGPMLTATLNFVSLWHLLLSGYKYEELNFNIYLQMAN